MQKIIPKISVLLPVYNAQHYIKETIESALQQTFADFELIIINDGSTDASQDIILSFDDPRIRYVQNEQNLGLIATLNKGLQLCRGEYIARMDADDISFPQRFEKQMAYLDINPQVGLLGTWIQLVNAEGDIIREVKYSSGGELRTMMALCDQFAHSSVMMRRSVLVKHNLVYNPNYKYAEDYKLWIDMMDYCEADNLPLFLSVYCWHDSNTSMQHHEEQLNNTDRIRHEYICKLLHRELRLNTTKLLLARTMVVEDWDEYLWMLTKLHKQLKSENLYRTIGDSLSYALKCTQYPFRRILQGISLFASTKQIVLVFWHWIKTKLL